jgi:hypothetical protein
MSDELETRPCLFCKKKLEPALPPFESENTDVWKTRQPWGGGEIRFVFCYGSTEYDLNMNRTEFGAYICDECASKFVPEMERLDDPS